jgi:phage tail protein X
VADDLSTDVDGAVRVRRQLDTVAADVRERYGRLTAAVAGLGQVWGTDEIGALLSTAYEELSKVATETVDSVAAGYADLGAGLVDGFEIIEADDAASAEEVRQTDGR